MAKKNATVHVEGADALNRALRDVGNRAGGLTLKRAAQAGADVIAEEAKRLAPRDSGDLAEGIDAKPRQVQAGRTVMDIAPSKRQWYGRLVELGTEKMAAQPFLRPAFDAKKDEATEAVRQVLLDALRGVL